MDTVKKGCEWCHLGPGRPTFRSLLLVLQIGVAVAVVTITYFRLENKFGYQCLLGNHIGAYALCYMSYAVAGVSMVASLLLILAIALGMLTRCLHIAPWLELALGFIGSIAWIGASIVLTIYTVDASHYSVPQKHWRNAVVGLSWANVLLFLLLLTMALMSVFYVIFGWCGGRHAMQERKEEKRQRKTMAKTEEEAPGIQEMKDIGAAPVTREDISPAGVTGQLEPVQEMGMPEQQQVYSEEV